MAKMTVTRMVVSLDADSKRVIGKLTRAVEKLSRVLTPYEVKSLADPEGRVDKLVQRLQESGIAEGDAEDWKDVEVDVISFREAWGKEVGLSE